MITLLKNLFLFKDTDFEEICKKYSLEDKISVTKYADGEEILSADEKTGGIFVVADGKGKIISVSKKHDAPLRNLTVGDTFGAASLYGSGASHRTKVIAVGQLSAAVLPLETVTELIENESEIALNYIRFLSDRVAFLNRKIAAFSAGSAEEKLALYLLSLPFENGACTLAESYTDIAKMLDTGRASLYRSIEAFEQNGIIHRDGRKIFLDDAAALYEMIN